MSKTKEESTVGKEAAVGHWQAERLSMANRKVLTAEFELVAAKEKLAVAKKQLAALK